MHAHWKAQNANARAAQYYSMAKLKYYDDAWAKDCHSGLEWEMLSWKMDVEEPDAALIISIALNKKNEAAMKTGHLEIMATLVKRCDSDGTEIARRPYGVPRMGVLGQGFPLVSYRPLEPKRREQFVQWTFTHAFDALSPAVAGIIQCTRDDKDMFPFKVDNSMGSASWSWPEGPISKQKLASYDLFDPHRQFFQRGAHMPLMVYMGGSSESRRSKVALAKRAANAARRGWTWERRQSTKAESGIRDGGEHRKGKQKGRGMHAHGDGEPSDGKGKGGNWGRSRYYGPPAVAGNRARER